MLDIPVSPLVKALAPSIESFLTSDIRSQNDPEKMWQYAQLRRNHFYYTDRQHLQLTQGGMGVLDYKPVSGGMEPRSKNIDSPFDYSLNIYKGLIDKFVAVLGSRSPNVQAMARDLGNESQARLKRKADRLAPYLRSHWGMDAFHRHLCLSLAKNGTTFSFARWVTNKQRYGETVLPTFDIQDMPMGEAVYQCPRCGTETPEAQASSLGPAPMCQGCGSPLGMESLQSAPMVPTPIQTGQQVYENGAVEMTLVTPDAALVPFWIKNLDEAPWLLYEYEEDKGKLVQAYPQLRPMAQSEMDYLDTTPSARYTRDVFTSPTGYVWGRRKGRWLYSRLWLDASTYEVLPNDQSGNLRQQISEVCPEGTKITRIAGKIIDIQPDNFRRGWAACKPGPSESIYCDPYFNSLIQIQDCINDAENMVVETIERVTPLVGVANDLLDVERFREYANLPGEFVPLLVSAGTDVNKSIIKFPGAEVNPALFNFIDWLLQKGQEITGILPAIFGAGEGTQTAREAEIRRNQALAQLNTVWNEIRGFEARTYENGAYQAAKFSGGKLYSSKGSRDSVEAMEIADIEELLSPGWYYSVEESMPMTPGQRRDQAMEFLNMPPQSMGAVVLDVGNPANLGGLMEAVGRPDWKIKNLAMRERLLDIIAQLAQQPPTMPPPMLDPMGMPDPMAPPPMPQPSISPDTFLFDPMIAVETVRDYLLGEQGRELEESNPDGFQNVLLYGQAYMAILNTPPPAPPGGSGGPPPEKKDGEEGMEDRPPTGEGAAPPPPPQPGGLAGAPVQ